MRHLSVWVLFAVAMLVGGTPVLVAQDGGSASTGPRFLLAASDGGPLVPVDVGRTPILRRRLELDLDGVSVKQAIQTIEQKAGIKVWYSDEVLNHGATVHLIARDITLAAALSGVLVESGVDVVFGKDGSASLVKQQHEEVGTVAGVVTDSATRQGIPGVTVLVSGTQHGTVTDESGRFRITGVPAGSYTLTARRIGYQPASRVVRVTDNQETTANFALTAAASLLDQVVTTATGGTERKRENGATIGMVQLDAVPLAATNNAADVLAARVPGVSVGTPNGTAGSSTRIRIRGSNSISLSNDPLIIVDGVRVDNSSNSVGIYTGADGPSRINDFSPENIADIQVIKGPAAAALYGTAAANGVIQITTKQGQSGKARFDAFAEGGSIKEVTDFPANYSQIGTTSNGQRITGCDIILQGAGICTAIADSLVSWNPLEQASPFITGNRANYGLSASGGSDKTTYYLGGAYQKEQGIYESNKLRNINGRINLRSQLRDNLDAAVNVGYMDGYVARPQDGDAYNSIVSQGLFGTAFDDPLRHGYNFSTPEQAQQVHTEQDVHHFTGGLTSNYSPLHWLTFTGVGGVDYVNRLDAQLIPPGVFTPDQDPDFAVGQRTLTPYQIFNYTANGSAVAKYTVGWLHAASANTTVGFQYNRSRTSGSYASGVGLTPGTQSLAGATSKFTVGETNTGLATLGYLAQQQLSWNDRIFVTGAIRTDRTSAFGTDFSRVYYPAGSLSWVIGDEPFFPKTDVLSSLRLRVAYGASGQNPSFRQAITYFAPISVTVGGASVPGVKIGGTGNPDLKPEQTKEFEAGFDAGFFRGRISTEFTYYTKSTDDALVAQQLPPSLGIASSRFINIGNVRNSGIELLVNGRLLDTDPVAIDLTLNGATTHNKVVNLGEGIAPIIGQFQSVQTGYPLGGFFQQGVKSYSDANGDGVIDASEIVLTDPHIYMGPPAPTRTLAVTPAVTLFHNIRVSAMFDYRGGQKLMDYNEGVRCAFNAICAAIQDRNAPLADQANAVAASQFGAFGGYVEDASFTKLREVAVTLTAPDGWARRFGTKGLSLTLAGRNLHTWTNYGGIDPEAAISTDGYGALDLESTPQVRYYTARINVSW